VKPLQNYPVLRIMATLLVVLGIIIIVSGLVASPIIAEKIYQPTTTQIVTNPPSGYKIPPITRPMDGTTIMIILAISMASIFVGCSLIANGEMIFLFINIQADTSLIKQLLAKK